MGFSGVFALKALVWVRSGTVSAAPDIGIVGRSWLPAGLSGERMIPRGWISTNFMGKLTSAPDCDWISVLYVIRGRKGGAILYKNDHAWA